MLYKFLFPSRPDDVKSSVLLLIVRIVFGCLLMSHGIQKWIHFSELSATFPDPIGVGSYWALILAIFAEVFCSVAFVFGFLYRLAMLPMIFTLCMAFFIVLANAHFAVKELALVYLIVFIVLYITGPGKFAIDRLFALKKHKEGRSNR